MADHDELTPSSLLSAAEHQALDLSCQLANLMAKIIGDGPTSSNDWTEAAQAIHVVQNMILSQAAARAYPDRYRLMGQVVTLAAAGSATPEAHGD